MTANAEAFFWARNTRAALEFMKALPDDNVELCTYNGGRRRTDDPMAKPVVGPHHCGGIACLGGWVAVMPYFTMLGVEPDKENGAPRISGFGDDTDAVTVAHLLFGDCNMFDARDDSNEPKKMGSDRNVAIHRLKQNLRDLKCDYPDEVKWTKQVKQYEYTIQE